MTWGNPPKFVNVDKPSAKKVTPEDLAKSGSEDGHQAALFCWAAANIVQYPQLKYIFAIPNGGSRHIAEATKMVATGLRRGVPDVCLLWPNINYAGLWLEMKIKKGKVSKEQKDWLDYLSSVGYDTAVCYSWQEAKDKILGYLDASQRP